MEFFNPKLFFNSLFYSLFGTLVFWVGFIVIDKLTPYHLWKELVEEKNVAIAIVAAAMCLSVAIIVAASVHG